MRFGICVPLENAGAAMAAGYDFVELPLAPTLQPENDDETVLARVMETVQKEGAVVDAFNIFLPGDLAVVGPAVDTARQEQYVRTAFARATALGAAIVVFGSGRSRMVPEGFDRALATKQIEGFLRLCARFARPLTLVIEPLNRDECNIINSVPEAVSVAQSVSSAHISVLSDLYHVTKDGQPLADTALATDLLRHVHIAGAEDRRIPDERDFDHLRAYFSVLKKMNYGTAYPGRISIEAKFDDLTRQGPEALSVTQSAWAAA